MARPGGRQIPGRNKNIRAGKRNIGGIRAEKNIHPGSKKCEPLSTAVVRPYDGRLISTWTCVRIHHIQICKISAKRKQKLPKAQASYVATVVVQCAADYVGCRKNPSVIV